MTHEPGQVGAAPGAGLVAMVRPVSAAFARCELTHLVREPIDVGRARRQHAAYAALLAELGCTLLSLPEEPELPDAAFVEDAAVVVDELAVITRPGAASRRAETATVEAALAAHRPLARIEAPGTLDGGDVLRVGRQLHVGASSRSNAEGIAQLRSHLEPFGYSVRATGMRDCLHLKTAATEVAPGVLLVNPAWLAPGELREYSWIEADPAEPFAGNALRVGSVLVVAAFPRTAARLRAHGLDVRTVEMDEIGKAEAGPTCCSVLLRAR